MTASHSSRIVLTEIVASSAGGAFLIVYGLGLYAKVNFLTPEMLRAFGGIGLLVTLLSVFFKVDRRVQVLSVVMTAAAFVRYSLIRDKGFLPTAFLVATGALFLLYMVWMYREELGPYVLLSGAISGTVMILLLTSHFLRVTNGLVLVGAALAFLMGKQRIRKGGDSVPVYKLLMMKTVIPCGCILLGGLIGHAEIWYVLAAGSAASGVVMGHADKTEESV